MNTLVPILIAMSFLIFLVILPIYLGNRAAKKAKEKQREEERKRIEALNSPERLARRQEMLQRNKLSYGDPIRVTQGYHKSDIAVTTDRLNTVLSRLPEVVAKRKEEQERHNAEMEMLLKEQNIRLQQMHATQVFDWVTRDND